jgi:hypothetical protein
VYVDNLIYATKTTQQIKDLKEIVHSKFKYRDLGPINYYLRVKITQDRSKRTIELSIEPYITLIAEEYNRTSAPRRKRPLHPNVLAFKLRPKDNPAKPNLLKRYQTLVGKLLYPACLIRPNIAFHVGFLGRFTSNPTYKQHNAAILVLNYLYHHRHLAQKYGNSRDLTRYSNASFANREDRKSTSSYVFKLSSRVIYHKSQKQRLVTTSTTKAKYVALTHAAKEATWLQYLLTKLRYRGSDLLPFKLYGDNKPSIKLAHSDRYSSRTKHVNLYYHYIKDKVRSGRINLQHISTAKIVANGITKPLSAKLHKRFITQLGLYNPRSSTH